MYIYYVVRIHNRPKSKWSIGADKRPALWAGNGRGSTGFGEGCGGIE